MRLLRSEDFQDLEGLREALGWDLWADEGPLAEVRTIIERVRSEGDAALIDLTRRLDGVDLARVGLKVNEDELERSQGKVGSEFVDALRVAARTIASFHRHQTWESQFWDTEEGARIGQLIRAIRRVGIYVPGGNASYPSTVLMTVIPAQVAGVQEMAVCVPPRRDGEVDPHTLYALRHLGVKEVYRVGGAQAIAAMAFGTETVKPVEKVVGPGNLYVALAKKEVFGRVGIDMLAGPSELVILADSQASTESLAWELSAQLEHGGGARACLITDTERILRDTMKRLEEILSGHVDLLEHTGGVIVRDIKEGARLVDVLAPEHLILDTMDVTGILSNIHNAGTIFLGPESSVTLGDYAVGVNHVLPTKGAARYASPLGVYDFIKRSNIVFSNSRANKNLGKVVETLARVEGLMKHAESMMRRLR